MKNTNLIKMKNKTHTKQEKEKTQKLKNIQYRNKTPQKNTKKKKSFLLVPTVTWGTTVMGN